MCNILQSCDQTFDVNCGPQSEVIVLGTPKRVIQEKTKALAHAAADVSERGIASIHLDVKSMIVKMWLQPGHLQRGWVFCLYLPPRRLHLTEKMIKKKLAFCKKYKAWTE
jgi:hypothetical protein